jgi:sRNA-binding carbon storage regulator CsrA
MQSSSKRSISSRRYWLARKRVAGCGGGLSYLCSFAGQERVIDYPHDDFTTKEGIVMSHLILTRRAGQSIVLTLAPDADPEKTLLQFLRDGITVEIRQIESGNVRVSIDAPRTIQILRNELIHP